MKHDTHERGAISEMVVMTEFTKLGYAVSRPITEERYDIIVELRDEGLSKVQIKRAYPVERDDIVSGVAIAVDLRAGMEHKGYAKGDIDYFAIHDPKNEDVYWLSIEEAPDSGATRKRENWLNDRLVDSVPHLNE